MLNISEVLFMINKTLMGKNILTVKGSFEFSDFIFNLETVTDSTYMSVTFTPCTAIVTTLSATN